MKRNGLRILFVAMALPQVALVQGCGECDAEPLCADVLYVHIERTWAEGPHRLVAEADGDRITCEWTVTDSSVEGMVVCQVDVDSQRATGEINLRADGGILMIPDSPEKVHLQIFEGDALVFEKTIEPDDDYEEEDAGFDLFGCSVEAHCGGEVTVDAS